METGSHTHLPCPNRKGDNFNLFSSSCDQTPGEKQLKGEGLTLAPFKKGEGPVDGPRCLPPSLMTRLQSLRPSRHKGRPHLHKFSSDRRMCTVACMCPSFHKQINKCFKF